MSDPLTPEGFAAIQKATLEAAIQVYPARAFYPSQCAHPCDRFLTWRFTRWQEQRPHDFVIESIFDQGKAAQPVVYARLEKMGYMIIRESDRPRQWTPRGKAVISGRIDGKLIGFHAEKFTVPRVLEVKTAQGYTWERLNTIDDVKQAEQHYVRSYAAQGNLYLLLEECSDGVMVIANKANGLLKLIPFELDYDAAEALLLRIERVQGMVEAKEDPPPIPYDFGICGRCPFGHVCFPPQNFGAGVQIFSDLVLMDSLLHEIDLKAKASEFEKLKRENRAALKRIGTFEQALLGNVLITQKTRHVKGYTVEPRDDVYYTIERVDEAVKEIE